MLRSTTSFSAWKLSPSTRASTIARSSIHPSPSSKPGRLERTSSPLISVMNPSLPKLTPRMGTDDGVMIRATRKIVPSPPMLRIKSVSANCGLALSSS